MLNKTDGVLMSVALMRGAKSIALTMTKIVDAEFFVCRVFGVLQKIQEITQSKFVA